MRTVLSSRGGSPFPPRNKTSLTGTLGYPEGKPFLQWRRAKEKGSFNQVNARKNPARNGHASEQRRGRATLPAAYGRQSSNTRSGKTGQGVSSVCSRSTETAAPFSPAFECTRTSHLFRKNRNCPYCSFYHNLIHLLFFQQYPVFFIIFTTFSSFFPSFSLKKPFHPLHSPFSGMRFNFFWENIDKPSENS